MTALQSIRPAAGGIVRNPILVVITALFGLSQLPNLFIQKPRRIPRPTVGGEEADTRCDLHGFY